MYPFIKVDTGTTQWTTYTYNLNCSCRVMFCITSPCCKCS